MLITKVKSAPTKDHSAPTKDHSAPTKDHSAPKRPSSAMFLFIGSIYGSVFIRFNKFFFWFF